jgi:hypothetical protein
MEIWFLQQTVLTRSGRCIYTTVVLICYAEKCEVRSDETYRLKNGIAPANFRGGRQWRRRAVSSPAYF